MEASRNPIQKLRQSPGEEHCLHLKDVSATSYSHAQILSEGIAHSGLDSLTSIRDQGDVPLRETILQLRFDLFEACQVDNHD